MLKDAVQKRKRFVIFGFYSRIATQRESLHGRYSQNIETHLSFQSFKFRIVWDAPAPIPWLPVQTNLLQSKSECVFS